jgi:hypothetical protein
MSASAERRAVIALLAVFALLVQALVPSIANAARVGPGGQVICTGHGLQTIPTGDIAPAQGTPSRPCEHCVCPLLAAAPPPALTYAVARLSYSREAAPAAAPGDLPTPARAPPRPPGQGPPDSDA